MIATRICKDLLEKGYTVRATVRNPKDEAKTDALRKLAAALPGELELHEVIQSRVKNCPGATHHTAATRAAMISHTRYRAAFNLSARQDLHSMSQH